MTSLTGKVAAVTGAGSGIGRAVAEGLVARGARVSVSDIDEAAAAETARLIDAEHHQQLDVSDRAAVEAYAATVADQFGVVHQVYNNAGISRQRTVLDATFEDYERILGVNLWGVIYGTKAFLPHLIASGDGHVINVSSIQGYMAFPKLSSYVTSKFAVRGFSETLRSELLASRTPVKVSVVYPGGVNTDIVANATAFARADGIEVSAADEQFASEYQRRFQKLAPKAAAKQILDGVERGKSRILVGNDAKALEKLIRLMPARYVPVVARVAKRQGIV